MVFSIFGIAKINPLATIGQQEYTNTGPIRKSAKQGPEKRACWQKKKNAWKAAPDQVSRQGAAFPAGCAWRRRGSHAPSLVVAKQDGPGTQHGERRTRKWTGCMAKHDHGVCGFSRGRGAGRGEVCYFFARGGRKCGLVVQGMVRSEGLR
jgi:hypothetical protein